MKIANSMARRLEGSAQRPARRHRPRRRLKHLRVERLELRLLLDGHGLAWESGADPGDGRQLPPHGIYAPGTPMEVVEAFEGALHLHDDEGPSAFTFGDNNRWRRTANDGFNPSQGNATRLSWSIVPDGTITVNDSNGGASGLGSNLVARLDTIYGSSGHTSLETRPWFSLFDGVFERWSDVSGIEFVYEPNDDGATQSHGNSGQVGVRGDIRIGGHNIDGNSGVLAYNYFPDFGEMVIDTGDSFYAGTHSNSIRLRNVLAHEVGHGLGISHVEPVDQTKLMEPFLTTSFDGPQFDDILATHRGYGDRFENAGGNDTLAGATDLGSLNIGQAIVIGTDAGDIRVLPTDIDFLSIDDNADTDFFRFNVASPAAVNVVLTPVGPTYMSGNQGGTPSPFDAAAQSNLSVAVLDSNGGSVLGTADATGIGQQEILADVVLPTAGAYFVHVRGAQNAAQFYQLNVMAEAAASIETRIVDNGDAGFTTTGTWTPWGGQGYQSDIHEALPGSGAGAASWTFTGLQPGMYSVAATWTTYSNRATNAPFEIGDGSNVLATTRVDQRVGPIGFAAANATWQPLGGPQAITGSTLLVRLTDDANGRLNADAIRIERVDDLVAEPEIQVLDGTIDIADGSHSISLGSTPPGTPVSRTFTVRNVGTQTLNLSEPIRVPAGFAVTSSFGATALAAGEATTFRVQLTAATAGTFAGEVAFDTNDADENPFHFNIDGSVVAAPPPPVVQIQDDSGTGFATVGGWGQWGGQGYQGGIHEALPGSGLQFASWTFSGLQPGLYEVAATWTSYSNRATNSPFEIYDGATLLATRRVNQQLVPSGFSDDGATWQRLGDAYAIAGATLVVRLTDDANGRLNADAVRIARVGDLVNVPEIQVLDGVTDIADGTGLVSLGSTPPGTPIARTFTVQNLGTQPLTLSEPISVPAGFVVASSFGATTLAAGESTSFVVQLTAADSGSFSGDVSFGNNDDDESPFNFTIEGSVAAVPPPPLVAILDNGEPGFSTVGGWSQWGGQGYQGDIHEALPGSGANAATWAFTGLVPGRYAVSATWTTYSNRATNAPYEVYDGSTLLATERVNQRIAPSGFSDAGATWQPLGEPLAVTGSSLLVRLTDDANGRLNADAIRIERVGDLINAPEIQVLDGATEIADGSGSVAFGNTTPAAPLERTFTVRNVGTQVLLLDEPIQVPAGFTVTAGFGATTLAAGASTTFRIELAAAAEGSFSGEVSFGTNDGDENPFNFTIQASVSDVPPPPAVQIIDNGDAGFMTTGGWTRWGGQGFQGDVHEALPGPASTEARWTFDNLVPGTYIVAATWSAYSNRATDAPFTIYDGATSLVTQQVNQRLAPSGFSSDGGTWQPLGSVAIQGNSLIVALGANANGRLNADAIRIERVSISVLGSSPPMSVAGGTADAGRPVTRAATRGFVKVPQFDELPAHLPTNAHRAENAPLQAANARNVDRWFAALRVARADRNRVQGSRPAVDRALDHAFAQWIP